VILKAVTTSLLRNNMNNYFDEISGAGDILIVSCSNNEDEILVVISIK